MQFAESLSKCWRRILFSCALVVLMSVSSAAAETQAEDILRPWIAKQGRIRTLHATFVQTRRLPMIKFPVKNSGEIWFGPGGWFRWQVGSPPELLAIRGPVGMALAQPGKQRARIFEPGAPGSQAAPFASMSLPFASSYEDFSKRYKVLELLTEGDLVGVTLQPLDLVTAKYLTSIRVAFDPASGGVRIFFLRLTDGSEIVTELSCMEINPKIPDAMFAFDFEGYQIDDQRKKGVP